MEQPLDALRRELLELARAPGRDVARHLRAVEHHLLALLRAGGLDDCGDVRLYGPTSMAPRSDLVGHAFLLERRAAVPVRVGLPEADGRGGSVRCGEPAAALPPAELERAWRQDDFPSGPPELARAWSLDPHARPAARPGGGAALVRALAALVELGASQERLLTALFDRWGAPPADAEPGVAALGAAVRDLLAALDAGADEGVAPRAPAPPPAPPAPSPSWEAPRPGVAPPPPVWTDDRAAAPPPPRRPWDGPVVDVDFTDVDEVPPGDPRALPGPRRER